MNLAVAPATAETLRELAAWCYLPPNDLYDGDAEPVADPERFYERAGFRRTGAHVRRFRRWSDVEFVEMEESTR